MANDKADLMARRAAEPSQVKIEEAHNTKQRLMQQRLGPTVAVAEADPNQLHLTFDTTGTKDELKVWWDQYCSNHHLLHAIRDKGDAAIEAVFDSPVGLRFKGEGQYSSADSWKFDIQAVEVIPAEKEA